MQIDLPFLERGVPVLHLIPMPFPSFWHKFDDNFKNVDRTVVQDWAALLRILLSEYLHS